MVKTQTVTNYICEVCNRVFSSNYEEALKHEQIPVTGKYLPKGLVLFNKDIGTLLVVGKEQGIRKGSHELAYYCYTVNLLEIEKEGLEGSLGLLGANLEFKTHSELSAFFLPKTLEEYIPDDKTLQEIKKRIDAKPHLKSEWFYFIGVSLENLTNDLSRTD